MTTLPTKTVLQSILVLLAEAYAGPPDPSGTWFVDNEPNCGVLGVLAGVSAVEASTSVDGSGSRGSTIAANAEHLRWSLANMNATLRGRPWNPDWDESWDLVTADEEKWNRLRQDLRAEYEALVEGIGQQVELPGEYLNGGIALVPHAALHLGIIRQMVERVRSASK